MLVARSYGHGSNRRSSSSNLTDRGSSKDARLSRHQKPPTSPAPSCNRPRSSADQESRQAPRQHDDRRASTHAKGLSAPMAVPAKKTAKSSHRNASPLSPPTPHDPLSMPASVAALLAMTQIPPRRPTRKNCSRYTVPERMSPESLRKEWETMDKAAQSLSSSPQMDVLLSTPGDLEELTEDASFAEADQDEEECDMLSPPLVRSTSNESMPSLAADDAGSIASWQSPTTPQYRDCERKRPSLARKSKGLPSSPTEDVTDDHPLMLADVDPIEIGAPDVQAHSLMPPPKRNSISQPLLRFRSNLSASISLLRSAARSLSNFAAPSMPPDDHLSRGLFSPPSASPAGIGFREFLSYRPELRPRPFSTPPTAQLRRYLNPHAFQMHDFHLHGTMIDHADLENLAARITKDRESNDIVQLKDYSSILEARRAANEALHLTEAGRVRTSNSGCDGEALNTIAAEQRREPRENAEFLRITVLEMQMVRAGKMRGPVGIRGGRRGFWLAPREVTSSRSRSGASSEAPQSSSTPIPRRWEGETPD